MTIKKWIPGRLKTFLSDSRLKILDAFYNVCPRTATCHVRGLRISVWVSSWIEKYRVDSYEIKEPDTLDWIDRELKDNDVFYDIGGNIGVYSLYAAARNKQARIFSFEPEAQNFWHLCKNIHLNNFTNIIPCSLALSDNENFNYLHITTMTAGSAFHSLDAPSVHRVEKNSPLLKQGVLPVMLDSLINRYHLPLPTLLKLDVDGHEGKVIKGAEQTIRSGLIRSLLVEITGLPAKPPASDILSFFKSAGYEIVSTTVTDGLTQAGEPSANYIFYKKTPSSY